MAHTVPPVCITHMELLKPITAPSLLPQQAIIHRKGEAANLLAGWLGGQRGLSHQSTAVLNENRKWFTSLMLQPSACLPACQPLPHAASSVVFLQKWNREHRAKEIMIMAIQCLKTAVMRRSHEFSVLVSMTSAGCCVFGFVFVLTRFPWACGGWGGGADLTWLLTV